MIDVVSNLKGYSVIFLSCFLIGLFWILDSKRSDDNMIKYIFKILWIILSYTLV